MYETEESMEGWIVGAMRSLELRYNATEVHGIVADSEGNSLLLEYLRAARYPDPLQPSPEQLALWAISRA